MLSCWNKNCNDNQIENLISNSSCGREIAKKLLQKIIIIHLKLFAFILELLSFFMSWHFMYFNISFHSKLILWIYIFHYWKYQINGTLYNLFYWSHIWNPRIPGGNRLDIVESTGCKLGLVLPSSDYNLMLLRKRKKLD